MDRQIKMSNTKAKKTRSCLTESFKNVSKSCVLRTGTALDTG